MISVSKREQTGFTIVELLIVIIVIAVLATLIIVGYNGITRSAIEAGLKSDLRNTASKLLNYKTTEGSFPGALSSSEAVQSSSTAFVYQITSDGFCLSATTTTSGGPVFKISQEGAIETGGCPVWWTQISEGWGHAVALTSNNKVYTMGRNQYGELGDGTNLYKENPTDITSSGSLNGKTVVTVVAGTYSSYAVASDGTVHSWGQNTSGRLGDGTTTARTRPVNISTASVLNGKTITKISAGLGHVLVVASDGTLYAWGDNSSGQFGNGSTTSSSSPVNVPIAGTLSGKTISSIAAGFGISHAIATDNTVHAWGSGSGLGSGSTSTQTLPVNITNSGSLSGKTITSVISHNLTSSCLAIASDGTLHAWGGNTSGQLGDGSTSQRNSPVNISTSSLLNGQQVVAAAISTATGGAVTSTGTVYLWGSNFSYTLADGTTTPSLVPKAVSSYGAFSGATITILALGNTFGGAIGNNGTNGILYGWGQNFGQIGDGTSNIRQTPVSVIAPQ